MSAELMTSLQGRSKVVTSALWLTKARNVPPALRQCIEMAILLFRDSRYLVELLQEHERGARPPSGMSLQAEQTDPGRIRWRQQQRRWPDIELAVLDACNTLLELELVLDARCRPAQSGENTESEKPENDDSTAKTDAGQAGKGNGATDQPLRETPPLPRKRRVVLITAADAEAIGALSQPLRSQHAAVVNEIGHLQTYFAQATVLQPRLAMAGRVELGGVPSLGAASGGPDGQDGRGQPTPPPEYHRTPPPDYQQMTGATGTGTGTGTSASSFSSTPPRMTTFENIGLLRSVFGGPATPLPPSTMHTNSTGQPLPAGGLGSSMNRGGGTSFGAYTSYQQRVPAMTGAPLQRTSTSSSTASTGLGALFGGGVSAAARGSSHRSFSSSSGASYSQYGMYGTGGGGGMGMGGQGPYGGNVYGANNNSSNPWSSSTSLPYRPGSIYEAQGDHRLRGQASTTTLVEADNRAFVAELPAAASAGGVVRRDIEDALHPPKDWLDAEFEPAPSSSTAGSFVAELPAEIPEGLEVSRKEKPAELPGGSSSTANTKGAEAEAETAEVSPDRADAISPDTPETGVESPTTDTVSPASPEAPKAAEGPVAGGASREKVTTASPAASPPSSTHARLPGAAPPIPPKRPPPPPTATSPTISVTSPAEDERSPSSPSFSAPTAPTYAPPPPPSPIPPADYARFNVVKRKAVGSVTSVSPRPSTESLVSKVSGE